MTAGPALQGTVHGGQQPVSGARVYLLAASTSGYGQPSASVLNASLLPSDSIGAYVASDANGNFSITGDYLCTANTQLYLYAKGGNPGAGTNPYIGLLAALGTCPATGSFATSVPFLVVNEVTTVAAAYALAGFATDPTHVASSATGLAQTGVANAFLNAANLANIVNGSALLTTPAGNGTAPQARVNTLANILAACINSTPATSTTCATLVANAQASGVSPTDTAGAAINIAHDPGGAKVATLYGLVDSTAPFGPALTTKPSDFTLPITYTGARLTNFPNNFPYGQTTGLAIDGSGNIFTICPILGATAINKFSSTGADLSSSSTFVGNSTDHPQQVIIGPNNNVWVLNGTQSYNSHNTFAQFSNSGTLLSGAGYTGGTFTTYGGVDFAFDPAGNAVVSTDYTLVRFNSSGQLDPPTIAYPNLSGIDSIAFNPAGDTWFNGSSGNSSGLYEILPTGTAAPGSPFAGGSSPSSFGDLAIDAGSNVWGLGYNSSIGEFIGVFNSAGQPLFPSGIPYPGVNQPTFLSLDGAGAAFTNDFNTYSNGSQIARIVISGSTLLSTAVYGTGFLNTVYSNSALDGSGDLWVSDFLEGPNFTDGRLIQFVGIAAPVVTPLSAGVANGTLATRP